VPAVPTLNVIDAVPAPAVIAPSEIDHV
jgi:hypothetical protein